MLFFTIDFASNKTGKKKPNQLLPALKNPFNFPTPTPNFVEGVD